MIALAKRLPWNLIGYVLAFVLIVAGINHGLSFIPGTDQWRGKRAVAKVAVLEDQVSTLEREATGNAEIGQAVNEYHTREIIIREGTAQAIAEARSAPDATTPLTDERANRLRSADLRLCGQFPGLCASSDAADSGARDVRASDPSR